MGVLAGCWWMVAPLLPEAVCGSLAEMISKAGLALPAGPLNAGAVLPKAKMATKAKKGEASAIVKAQDHPHPPC